MNEVERGNEMKDIIKERLERYRRRLEKAKKRNDFAMCIHCEGGIEALLNLFYEDHLEKQKENDK